MPRPRPRRRLRTLAPLACLAALACGAGLAVADEGSADGGSADGSAVPRSAAGEPIDFARDVAPLLTERCARCHGPEKQKAGLRLDRRERVLDGVTVVAGDAAASLLVELVSSPDATERMPPEGEPLTAAEIALLRRWIDEGAEWPVDGASAEVAGGPNAERPAADRAAAERAAADRAAAERARVAATHWAYARPERPPVPAVRDAAWVRNAVDAFVLARLEAEGLAPAPEADRATLGRRVTLDLTGLPPTLAELDAFLADAAPDAYERLVDRLLASPHFGERWARPWLDLARYADTHGYEKDNRRTMWRWRDWVVDAINADMPFDRFTVEQLAGDLLPDATLAQRIATGFHRNTMINEEGGTDPEEFRVAAVVDRVSTTAEAWLGTTLACAQCHDHEYDPFTQREYYELYAFLDHTRDSGGAAAPEIPAPTAAQAAELARLDAEILELRAELEGADVAFDREQRRWEAALWPTLARADAAADAATPPPPAASPWSVVGPFPVAQAETDPRPAPLAEYLAGRPFASSYRGAAWTARPELADGAVHELSGERSVTYLFRTLTAERARRVALLVGSDDAFRLWLNGALVARSDAARAAAPDQDRAVVEIEPGENALLLEVRNYGGVGAFAFRVDPADPDGLAPELAAALRVPEALRDAEQSALVRRHFRTEVSGRGRELAAALFLREEERAALAERVPTALVLAERAEPRETRIHVRGSFLSQAERVSPGVPAALHPLPADAPRNRLGLARWLVARDNPLTPRVVANRIWAELLGAGLVTTPEDFGTRGEPPTHPRLLDWLARELADTGWSRKRLVRTIVTSAAYRQSSVVTPEKLERDPTNALLSRGPKRRVAAETVRDLALAVSGLLNPAIGGPSVFPPQPEGIWAMTYSGDRWTTSEGSDRYRRGLYTFWRRTAPYPTFLIFDAPSREIACSRRPRTSTPLQALATLNDPAFVECAGALALRLVREAPPAASARVAHGFRLCTARRPGPDETEVLVALYDAERAHYAADPAAARSLCASARVPPDAQADPTELAAWIVVSNALLNLDETLTQH